MTAILGISAFYHDSAAALVVDGRIVAAAQEERFTRRKHDPRFPASAVEYVLREGGLKAGDLDWVGFTIPKGAPKEAYEWLSKAVVAAMATPDLQQRIAGMGAEPNLLIGDDYGKMIQSETARWTEVIKTAGIKIE